MFVENGIKKNVKMKSWFSYYCMEFVQNNTLGKYRNKRKLSKMNNAEKKYLLISYKAR